MEQLTSTTDTKLAAAMGTLGVPIQIRSVLDTRTGREHPRMFLQLCSTDGIYRTKQLQKALFDGSLLRSQPVHPLLNIYRTYGDRDRVLDLLKKGFPLRLVQVPGTEVWQYSGVGDGLPGLPKKSVELITTGDLRMVCALSRVGLPLLHVEGNGDAHKFYLPRRGPVRKGFGPVDGYHLMAEWRRDRKSIPWEDPFAQSIRGLFTRERLQDCLRRVDPTLLMTKPGSTRAAYVLPNSEPCVFDAVKAFFAV